VTSAYVCWVLLNDPQKKILVVSASKNRADNFTTFTLQLIREMPLLQHLAPRAEQRASRVEFDVGPRYSGSVARQFVRWVLPLRLRVLALISSLQMT
jgi:hypothetical protein